MAVAPTKDKLVTTLPLLPLKDIVVFPHMVLPVFVSEDVCINAVECALAQERQIFLSAFCPEATDIASLLPQYPGLRTTLAAPFDVFDVGTVATVLRTRKLPDGRLKVLIQGVRKAKIVKPVQFEPFPLVQISFCDETTLLTELHSQSEALVRSIHDHLKKLTALGKGIVPDIFVAFEEGADPAHLCDIVASHLGLKVLEAQKILSMSDPIQTLQQLHGALVRELEISQMQHKIRSQAKEEVVKNQREQFLREQLRAIKLELGELDGKEDIEELRDKIVAANLPKDANAECLKQLRRLERMHPDTSESTLTRTYVEWMLDLPWNELNQSNTDLILCQKLLEEEHYGLQKVKDRVLEYMAVKHLNPQTKAPILCFVGPPGVGKTSLGRTIAKAIGRKFWRISLGGVRDEAEIRGHRRTYVGAMPGRIIQGIKNSGSRNPVLMLDEIDKLSSDYKGDPASALLEVLDPEQNHTFSDHYISVPFDLSQVFFIANANRLDTIPAALRDRLEVIEVGGYSDDEKIEIAKAHLLPRALQQHGLTAELVQFQDSAISILVRGYTREAGLRHLDKQVCSVIRKLARTVAENDLRNVERKTIKVTAKMVKELLGEEKLHEDVHDVSSVRIGVSTGLAYTPAGGEVLEIEVNLAEGKGNLVLTGQLGEVMRESAQAAHSYVRSQWKVLGLDPQCFLNSDLHIHVPAGAIPKDGPSAGVALAVAMISCYLGEPVRQNVAMTGEISIHGRVLPVGGLREKILAAQRLGITTVCVPERNRGVVNAIPLSARRKVQIRFVQSIEQVLKECFLNSAVSEKILSSTDWQQQSTPIFPRPQSAVAAQSKD